MRAREFIFEATNLAASELYKRGNTKRVELFLKKVAMQSPFKKLDGTPFIIDPNMYKELEKIFKSGKGGTVNVRDIEGNTISTSQLLKTPEFASYATEPDAPEEEEPQGNLNLRSPEEKAEKEKLKLSKLRKSSFKVQPSDIFEYNVAYSKNALYNTVLNSPLLKVDAAGPSAIKMAQDIIVGRKNPVFPEGTPPFMEAALHDNAGEWLGILAVLQNIAIFPNQSEFFKHLDLPSLDSVNISFPKDKNHKLSDSLGSFTNGNTGNEILISSKGRGGGASPAITGLKIPDDIANKKLYKKEKEFFDICKNDEYNAFTQVFYISNWIKKNYPSALPADIPFFTQEDIEILEMYRVKRKTKVRDFYNPTTKRFKVPYAEFPDNLKPLLKNIKYKDERNLIALIIAYETMGKVTTAVNEGNALYNFESMAREILQRNFIQINAKKQSAKSNELQFSVLWPNTNAATGRIYLMRRISQNEASAKIGFRIE
jgi:hypothetical protein